MGRQDIEAVYCLNSTEYEAFKMYFEGSSVSQIGHALNMTNSTAGNVLDSARDRVWGRMTEKRVIRGEVPDLSIDRYGNNKTENTKET